MKSLFEGVGIAIVTPFLDDAVDYKSLYRLIEKSIKDGANAIILLGTTGEGVSVSKEERLELIQFAKEQIAGRAKLIVGTGNNNFKTCFELTQMAKENGADGALVVTPYYNKTTQQGLIEYYRKLSELDFPLIIYNVPSRTGLNIELDTIQSIIQTNHTIYGIKESTCDINRIVKLCKICKDEIAVYSGEDSLNYVFYCLGANGTISVTANALCKKVKSVFDHVQANEIQLALCEQNTLEEINSALFSETNPIPIKHFLLCCGLIESDEVRLPLVRLQEKNKTKLRELSKLLPNEFDNEI